MTTVTKSATCCRCLRWHKREELTGDQFCPKCVGGGSLRGAKVKKKEKKMNIFFYNFISVDGVEEICHWPKDRQSQKAPLVIIAQNFNFVTDR